MREPNIEELAGTLLKKGGNGDSEDESDPDEFDDLADELHEAIEGKDKRAIARVLRASSALSRK